MVLMKRFLITTALILINVAANAHEYNSLQDSLLDEVLDELMANNRSDLEHLIDNPKNYHFLYFNSNYSPKTLYAGREIGKNAPSYSGQLFYFISNGLYFGVSGSYYQDFTPNYQSTPVMAGYSSGKKHFRYRASYSHYFYHIPDYEPLFSNALSTGISFIKKPFGIRGDYTLMFGEATDSKISLDAYADIKLLHFGNKNKLTLQPQVTLYFGTETVETEIIIAPEWPTSYDEDNVFGLMNTELSLPLAISLGSFMFEAEYTYHITRSLDPLYDYGNSHAFNISLGYIISLN